MDEKLMKRAGALTLLVLSAVGFVDAIRGDDTGTAVLFGVIFLGVLGLAREKQSTGSVTLRRDLASWLERTSPTSGESPDEMANRAVSRMRAGFSEHAHDHT